MANIELSAQLNGTSEASAEGRLSMALSATLRGVASSMGQRPPPPPVSEVKTGDKPKG